jgi:hypothetical protein
MRVMRVTWLAIIALGFWFNLCAASESSAKVVAKVASEPAGVASPMNAGRPSQAELELLKQQNADLKGFQSDVLLTMWSAFGALVVLTLALVGFGWFANFRMYERDKELLRKDLEGVVASSEARLQSALDSSLKTYTTKTDRRLNHLACDLKCLDTELQLETGNPSSAVTTGITALKRAIECNSEWRVKRQLRMLQQAVEDGGKFYEREIVEAFGLLTKVPAALSAQADELAPKIRAAQIMPKE